MNLRQVAHSLLQMRGSDISYSVLNGMTDAQVCELVEIPLPSKPTKKCRGKGEKLRLKHEPIMFNGYKAKNDEEIPFVHIDKAKAKKDLKYMKDKKEIVIESNQIKVEFDFGFDSPFRLTLSNNKKKHWTREDLVNKLVTAYSKCYQHKNKYKHIFHKGNDKIS